MTVRKALIGVLVVLLAWGPAPLAAQTAGDSGAAGGRFVNWFSGIANPYKVREEPPVSLANSSRMDALLRAGNIYLSLSDAIALALENNIDIAIQRYGARLAEASLLQAEAGGGAVPSYDPSVTYNLSWAIRPRRRRRHSSPAPRRCLRAA